MPARLVKGGLLLGLAGGVWFLISHLESSAYERGELAERAKWKEAQQEKQLHFREKHDTASAKAAERDAERERVFIPIEKEVIRYVQTPAAAVQFIDDVGAGIMRRAIEAANSSIAAGASESGSAMPSAAGGPRDGG